MNYEITENRALTASVHSMRLRGDTGSLTRPGQFVQVALPDFYLRRPISVCEWDRESLRLVYKVVGQGTAAMAEMKPGACLDLLPGLGNGFDTGACGEKPLLVGGGVGLPPLLGLCRALLAACPCAAGAAAGFGSSASSVPVMMMPSCQGRAGLGSPRCITGTGSTGSRDVPTCI